MHLFVIAMSTIGLSALLLAEDLPKLVEKTSPAVIALTVVTADGSTFTGSGFFVRPDGVAITNYHVVEGGRRITAKTSKGVKLFCSGILTLDEDCDLAVLKFGGKELPVLNLAKQTQVKKGQAVAVIGNPLGYEQSVSDGIISALRKEGDWEQIQITAPVSEGSSGSPVINMNGDVVGVATFTRTDGQALNFATSVKHLQDLVGSLEQLEVTPLAQALPARQKSKPSDGNPATQSSASPKSDPKAQGMDDFWESYWKSLSSNNSAEWVSHFTNSVDYQYKKTGRATKDDIRKGSQELNERYPNRNYSLKDKPKLVELANTSSRVGFDFAYTYTYRGAGKEASGTAYVELALQWTSDGWKIYKFREKVERQ